MANNSKIDRLKALFKQEKEKKENGGGGKYNKDIYPFWTMENGQSARVRILPDKNEDNPYIFFVDRLEHTLSIAGEDKKVPCRQMHGETCPICELSRKYYKDEGKESENGKYYYRKKTSLLRVLVVEDPLPPDKDSGENYEGKVLNTQFGYQLMEILKDQIGSEDLGDFYDFDEGTDFIIKKSAQGKYSTYSVGSKFARNSSAIPEDVQAEIELVDLSTLLPKDPGYEKVQNMLQAHLNGDEYEDEDSKPKKETSKPSSKRVVEEEETPAPRKTTTSKRVVEEEEEEETPAPRKTTTRKPEPEPEDEEEETPAPRKTTTRKPEPEPEDEEEEEDILALIQRRKAAAKK